MTTLILAGERAILFDLFIHCLLRDACSVVGDIRVLGT